MDMIHILLGAMILSIVHALMPDHWIPIAMISRTEKWSRIETSWITAFIAIPHIISTILIGIIIGIIGFKLSSTHEFVMRVAAPLILVAIGLVYVYLDSKGSNQHHDNKDFTRTDVPSKKKSKLAIILPLATALFFSPCVAIGSYFFVVGTTGWSGIVTVSAIYLSVTILGMVIMVNLALKGVRKIEWHFLERHEKLVTGVVLVVLGTLIYFVEI